MALGQDIEASRMDIISTYGEMSEDGSQYIIPAEKIDIAQKELQNIITPDKPREITPQLIIEVVSEHFNISMDQMISRSRSSDIARPRQIAMYLCKTMTDSSLDVIGSFLGGRDHSTIIHGIKKIGEEYDNKSCNFRVWKFGTWSRMCNKKEPQG